MKKPVVLGPRIKIVALRDKLGTNVSRKKQRPYGHLNLVAEVCRREREACRDQRCEQDHNQNGNETKKATLPKLTQKFANRGGAFPETHDAQGDDKSRDDEKYVNAEETPGEK